MIQRIRASYYGTARNPTQLSSTVQTPFHDHKQSFQLPRQSIYSPQVVYLILILRPLFFKRFLQGKRACLN